MLPRSQRKFLLLSKERETAFKLCGLGRRRRRRRHLWFAQFPRTFRSSTTKRDFALWPFSSSSSSSLRFLCFLVFFQKFFINFDWLERPGFLEFYKFLYICINRTKDLEIRNSSSRLSCFFSKNYFLILIVSKDRQRKI